MYIYIYIMAEVIITHHMWHSHSWLQKKDICKSVCEPKINIPKRKRLSRSSISHTYFMYL